MADTYEYSQDIRVLELRMEHHLLLDLVLQLRMAHQQLVDHFNRHATVVLSLLSVVYPMIAVASFR